MNESNSLRRQLKRLLVSVIASTGIVLILFSGPFFLPSVLANWLDGFYWELCWSQFIWEPIFPAPLGFSAPSLECYIAMLLTDILIISAGFYLLFTLRRRFLSTEQGAAANP